ncbi:glycine--tRNA ligase subunit beta [Candidatus Synechococcus calcipolaris G9]|uniref:Glycine--tRNA ligase beta subunit n=1 Tax=Candidatus Synechococcus calcipolaris G9 TaxID=1497997 RepID=A0ABT6F2L8_9SYNE|nr:glycine--tRNA ligase subunit beta [Candidatus Synechococcus calcipolaris]MDG2992109.1 glycine--tRNA ligase subunit beta [Candidatus Synechococcus calcipolaris G9]
MTDSSQHSFLLEVGTEDLPASFVQSAIAQWQRMIPAHLQDHGLGATVNVLGTPRRLVLVLDGLPAQQPDQHSEVKGPAAAIAFKNGEPTKALQGFLRSRQAVLEDIEIRSTEKGDVVFLKQTLRGQATPTLLSEWIPNWISQLEGPRFMRWSDGELRFSRPIRWLVALWDDQVLPVTLESQSVKITSDRQTWGHRVLAADPITLERAQDYGETMAQGYIEVDPEERKAKIIDQVNDRANTVKGYTDITETLLNEVTHLVEWPTAVLGNFEPEFLALPPEVITTVMVTHQRYFPVYGDRAHTKLLPHFITISNGDPQAADIIRQGNERVIRARLADGQFFYQADLAKPLADYGTKLETVTFQDELGSMAAKMARIQALAGAIADHLKLKPKQKNEIQRTAELCKNDLVSQMVGEFPELQGRMGQVYAEKSGESAAVSQGIFDHYLPRHGGDRLPESLTGQVVGLADRLDTLTCLFGLGQIPTGSSDPFALRRAANAVLLILWEARLPLNLHQVLQETSQHFCQTYPKTANPSQLQDQLQDFFGQRLRTLLEEDPTHPIDYDLVNAVLGNSDASATAQVLGDVLDARDRAQFLQRMRQEGSLQPIYATVNRAARLARQGTVERHTLSLEGIAIDKLQEPIEREFYQALQDTLPTVKTAQDQGDYGQIIAVLGALAPIVSRFFDGPESVLVMAPDPVIKANRLGLLSLLRNIGGVLGDFGEIVK